MLQCASARKIMERIETAFVERRTELLWKLMLKYYGSTFESSTVPMLEAVATHNPCAILQYYDDDCKLKAKADKEPLHNSTNDFCAKHYRTRTYCFTCQNASRFELVKDPEPPSVPPTKKQVDDLFQWFDDDEVIPPPAVPIPPVNAHAAQAPENAIGSPSTTVISEGAPAVTDSLFLIKYLYQTLVILILKHCSIMLTVMCLTPILASLN
ncbi:hypothetical protein Tco_0900113 [Tanacetum coccineum]